MPSNLFPHALNPKADTKDDEEPFKSLPKGIVLGKDGKPCRTCTSSSAWMAMMKSSTGSKSIASKPTALASTTPAVDTVEPSDCPPDVDALGRATWTFLHTLTATYPTTADPPTQKNTRTFLSLFADLYPCWICAADFRDWMAASPQNEPAVRTQDEFGDWMCRAHNAVNVKLGKPEFDCRLWKQRWKDGWKDGRCD